MIKFKLLILIVFTSAYAVVAQQNWVRTKFVIPEFIEQYSFFNSSVFSVRTFLRNYATQDGGTTFKQLKYTGDSLMLSGMAYLTKDTLLTISYQNMNYLNKTFFLKSDNGGNSFYPYYLIVNGTDTVFKRTEPKYIYFFDSQHGMVTGDTLNGEVQCYLTSDGAKTWTKANLSNLNGLPSARFHSNFWLDNQSRVGNDLFIGALGGADKYLLKITNYGATWSAIPINLANFTFSRTMMFDSVNGIAQLGYQQGSVIKGYLAKTVNGGITWDTSITRPPGFLGRVEYAKATPRNKAFHYCPDRLSGITYISYDTCKTWLRDDSLRLFGVYRFYDADFGIGQVRIGTDSVEIVMRDKIPTSLLEVKQDESNLFIYPNPVPNQLYFTHPIEEVEVIDNLGKSFAIPLSADGLHADVAALPQGHYFIRVKTTAGIAFRKFIKE